MSCGAEHSVGLSDTGAVYAWGWGSYGNLGDGERVDRWAPVKVRLRPCLQALAHDTADLAPSSICRCLHIAPIMPLHAFPTLGVQLVKSSSAPRQAAEHFAFASCWLHVSFCFCFCFVCHFPPSEDWELSHCCHLAFTETEHNSRDRVCLRF